MKVSTPCAVPIDWDSLTVDIVGGDGVAMPFNFRAGDNLAFVLHRELHLLRLRADVDESFTAIPVIVIRVVIRHKGFLDLYNLGADRRLIKDRTRRNETDYCNQHSQQKYFRFHCQHVSKVAVHPLDIPR